MEQLPHCPQLKNFLENVNHLSVHFKFRLRQFYIQTNQTRNTLRKWEIWKNEILAASLIKAELYQNGAVTRFPVATQICCRVCQHLWQICCICTWLHSALQKKSSNVSCFFLTAEYASLNHFIAMFNFQVFPGNKDRNTVTEHLLVTAFNARLIRFHPKTYHGHTSMRVEVYGCRNGMCMHESSTHFSTYIALDPKRKLKV